MLLRMGMGGAALILLTAVFRAFSKDVLPKRVFPVLWWLALARLLIPVSIPLERAASSVPGRGGDALRAVGGGVSELYAAVVPSGVAAQTPASAADAGGGTASVLTALWLTGCTLCAGYFLLSWLRGRRELRASVPIGRDIAGKRLSDLPLRGPVEVRALPGLSTPLTCGVLRPVILVPEDMDWDDGIAADFMLCHEYIHIRRFDTLAKLLAAAALCVHWFNPAVWLFWVLFNRDIELACDEAVVRRFGRERRAEYARTLIDMEERRVRPSPLRSYFAKSAIEERITSIMKIKKNTVISIILAAVLVVAAAGVFAASALTADPEDPQGFSSFGAYRVSGVIAGEDIDTSYYTDRVYIFRPDFYFLFRAGAEPLGVANESGVISYVEEDVSPTEFADMGISESMVYTDAEINGSTVRKYAVTYAGNPQFTLYVLDGSMWIRLLVGRSPAIPMIFELEEIAEDSLEDLIGVSWDGLAVKEEELT